LPSRILFLERPAQPASGLYEDSKKRPLVLTYTSNFKLQALYHITPKPTTTAPITGAILANQFGETDHRTAAPRADEDAAADPVPVPAPVPVAVELGLASETL
jgi:hypothetical protein